MSSATHGTDGTFAPVPHSLCAVMVVRHRENPLVALGRDLATEGLRYITKPGDFKVITYKLAGGAP